MVKWVLGAVALSVICSSTAQAQTIYHWPAAVGAGEGQSQAFFLPSGTPIKLRTLTQISSRDSKPGDRVYLEVAESVSFRGQVVIPVGSPVFGEVSVMQRNGHFGRKGKIGVRLIQVETPSGPIRLGGDAYKEGHSGTAASVATIVLVSWVGFVIHGTSAKVMPGSPVDAFLAEPLNFAWAPASNARLGVATAAQPDGTTGNRLGMNDRAQLPALHN